MKHVKTLTKRPEKGQDLDDVIGIIQLFVTIVTAIEAFSTAKD